MVIVTPHSLLAGGTSPGVHYTDERYGIISIHKLLKEQNLELMLRIVVSAVMEA